MKHSDWLRLQSDSAALASLRASGDCICANLRQHGYQCRKQTRRLSWKLSKEGQEDYILTFAPSPIADWSLIPNETSSARTQLWQLIENTLNRIRGEIKTTSSQHLSQAEDYSRPWAIIRLLPDARRYTVARFRNRQDAEDHLRFLKRYIPAAGFEVLFDVPNELTSTDEVKPS
ncbi:hypothetical protein H6F96_15005 [Microcoleus sp. FACHB-53]|nr:hypothetical protein [Microcoleus sp. FACHB-53]MBD2130421.1 hypothetical protein [Microcoleus sp. FACHB-1]